MKQLFCLMLLLIPGFLFSQQSRDSNAVEEPIYDTTSIDIKSTNSFYFCSKRYKIPRDCDKKDQSGCCSFSSQIFLNQKLPVSGHLGCYDGTSLSWNYFETDEQARSSFEGYSPQIKRQMKKFNQTAIKLFICNQKVTAYKLNYTTFQKYRGHEIIAYGTINGQHVMVHLHSQKELNSNNDMQPVFQEIIKFE